MTVDPTQRLPGGRQGLTRLLVPVLATALVAGASAADETISAEAIRRHTFVLGADDLAGRAVGTPGARRAARYIADALAEAGVPPADPAAGYLQPVPMHGSRPLPESALELRTTCGTRELRLAEDYVLYTAGQETFIPTPTPLVFAGYGIVAPEYDYSDYRGLDVRGKVVVLLAGEPHSDDPRFFAGERETVYSSPSTKLRTAMSRGARGSLLIPSLSQPDADGWAYRRLQFAFEDVTLAYALPDHLSARLSEDAARSLLCGSRSDLTALREEERLHTLRGFALDATVSFRGVFAERDFLSSNVVGLVRGSDPELSGTAVAVVAHYDHLGVGPPAGDDDIYNGVVDNAIGVAGVLEMARAVAAREERPRRSVLFLFPTGEEKGLLGSAFYTDHPVLPLGATVAAVNVDGLAFFDAFRDVVGVGAELSTLGDTLSRVAAGQGLAVSDARGALTSVFDRSDQKAFAEAGVPALLVNEGFDTVGHTPDQARAHAMRWARLRYHTPFDDLSQPLNFEATRQHAELLLALVVALADDPVAPRFRPGTPYAGAQLRLDAAKR